jgi:hypothetical protein
MDEENLYREIGDKVTIFGLDATLQSINVDADFPKTDIFFTYEFDDYPKTELRIFGTIALKKFVGEVFGLANAENNAAEINPITQEIGGSHYKGFAIEPIQFILANGLGFCEGNVVKYICRYKRKNGVEDLKKARHYIDFLIEREEHPETFEGRTLSNGGRTLPDPSPTAPETF